MTKRKEERVKKAKERAEVYAKLTLDQKIKKLEDAGHTRCSEYKRLVIMRDAQNQPKEETK